MTRRMLLLLFMLSCSFEACVSGGFRHYDPIMNCLPSTVDKIFLCTGPQGHYIIQFDDPASLKLVCFDQQEFATHEEACHAK
jgi:hypothetical protein